MERPSSVFADSKKHFLILDGLRGVAALVVVLFHILEVFSGGDHTKQLINHGYLAVDFFFVLSGFVMAHAYDDRWSKMTYKAFFKRRLVRLHPLIILGMTVGAICFYFGQSEIFPKIEETSLLQLLLVLAIGYTLIPLPPSMDIRGWNEMHPLNGPAWSLFLEYVANILHAFILRKLSKLVLGILVFFAAVALIHLAVTSPNGDIIGGWSLEPEQLHIGFTRLLYPYMAGMLLRRTLRFGNFKYAFLWSSILLVGVLSIPRIGGSDVLWANGLYDALSVIIIFPIIIYIGASGELKSKTAQKISTFLGDISYPLYILHFPFIYLYFAWVYNNNISMSQGIGAGIGLFIFTILFSYAALKFYDEPIRKWLAKKAGIN
ncbi:MAG: acyltransferase [Saprospiraceae bacterium]|nr:acyltransferase [Saprospiraceae bacterium]